jgi:hypothetical protein
MEWDRADDDWWDAKPAYLLVEADHTASWGVQKMNKKTVQAWESDYPALKGKIKQGWYLISQEFEWIDDDISSVLYCNATKRIFRTLKAAQTAGLMLRSAGVTK